VIELVDSVTRPLDYAFFQKGLLVATAAGALLGLIGVYVTLRGMSYIGHGLSHAVFGGFAASQLISAQYYLWGAGIWGYASALAISTVSRKHRIGSDAAIGVITTASFAMGVALLSRFGTTGPSFDNALFGSILGISRAQVWSVLATLVITLLVVFFNYRRLLFVTFDPAVAGVSGVSLARTDALLMFVLSLGILVTLTVIGVTLVAAMLVIPAVVARILANSFANILLLSTVVGALCGLVGMYLSYYAQVPSGTMVVLTGAAVFVVVMAVSRTRDRVAMVQGH
jgi:ABC-type Mn2+/Zn2+ transport system permease subunit